MPSHLHGMAASKVKSQGESSAAAWTSEACSETATATGLHQIVSTGSQPHWSRPYHEAVAANAEHSKWVEPCADAKVIVTVSIRVTSLRPTSLPPSGMQRGNKRLLPPALCALLKLQNGDVQQ